MNDHFQSVFINENLENLPLIDSSPYFTLPPITISASGTYIQTFFQLKSIQGNWT